MNKLFEKTKFDVGLTPQSLASTNATGSFFPMKDFHGAAFVLSVAAMAKTKTAVMQIYQATNAAAGSAKVITDAAATITANTLVSELTIALASVANTETITINGLVFTAHTDTTTKSTRTFSISGNDTADGDELASCINDPDYGVPGITASNDTGTITLTSTETGKTAITAASSDATFTVATTKAFAYVEIDNMTLDHAGDFDHVAAKVTTDSTQVVSVALLRGPGREAISQAAGASASV